MFVYRVKYKTFECKLQCALECDLYFQIWVYYETSWSILTFSQFATFYRYRYHPEHISALFFFTHNAEWYILFSYRSKETKYDLVFLESFLYQLPRPYTPCGFSAGHWSTVAGMSLDCSGCSGDSHQSSIHSPNYALTWKPHDILWETTKHAVLVVDEVRVVGRHC
jgi:hypothetical protein